MNKKQNFFYFLIVFGLAFFLTGCGNRDVKQQHKIISISTGSDIIINPSEITDQATFYNYEDDGVIIQLFAVKATDGTIRVVFNTCGACNPSPDSYFIQIGDYFECQNCKNKFHRDEIGLQKSYGCSPIAILDQEKEFVDGNILIKSDFIKSYRNKFQSINHFKG